MRTFQYISYDEKSQIIRMWSAYEYNIINPHYRLDINSFVSFFKYIIVADKYKEEPGVFLAHTWVEVSPKFKDVLSEYYSQKTMTVYVRNAKGDKLSKDNRIIHNPLKVFPGKAIQYKAVVDGKPIKLVVQSHIFGGNTIITRFYIDDYPQRLKSNIILNEIKFVFFNEDNICDVRIIPCDSLIYAGPIENPIYVFSSEGKISDLSIKIDKLIIKSESKIKIFDNLIFDHLITNPKIIQNLNN